MLKLKKLNCNVGYKRINYLLASIRNRTLLDAKLLLNISRTKYAVDIFRLIKSIDNRFIIKSVYATIGIRKNKRISMSHGNVVRQKSRRCHIFFEFDDSVKEQ